VPGSNLNECQADEKHDSRTLAMRQPPLAISAALVLTCIGLPWLSPTTFALKEQRTLEIKAPDLPEKLGPYGKPDADAAGGGGGNQPARHFIKFSAEASCQVVPGSGYRILDMKPGAFE
jgi:hypothetical protein